MGSKNDIVQSHQHDEERNYDAGMVRQRTWKGAIWDTFDLPKKERKLLFKVDAVLLTLASLGYFIKNLDQTNINSAFLSGMKEDLEMNGNQLVTAVTVWTVGYVVGQIPSNLLLTRIDPRWVIPSLELGWGIATLGSYGVKSYKALYALRFLVGLFESGFYPGIHYLLGSWYTPREIGKRSMIFWLAGTVGQMFSGFLQSAAYKNLNGTHGIAGWRWLFIIDAIITLPIAVAGFFLYPNLPLQGKKTWWLTDEEFTLSQDRLHNVGRAGKTAWSWTKLKKLGFSWHTWILPLLYVFWNNGYPQNPIGYYLKSFNSKTNPPVPGRTFTVSQINVLPLPGTAIFIGVALIFAWLSDGPFRGRRYPFIYFGAIVTIAFAAVLRQRPLYKNVDQQIHLYWLCVIGEGAGPLILSWINEICSGDTEKRAILVAAANDLAYVVQAIAPNFVWKTTDFPKATKGWTWVIGTNSLLILWTALVQGLLWWDRRREGGRQKRIDSPELIEDIDQKDSSVDGVEVPVVRTLV
ncbi:major facilitator superfamily domain-containing protein [Papiliotrema laurentii]|uniref:Major facilitator superfamily domain-containing protein n=1 Tax=Papiliotrema laurentii TaxID=5418 RepID=A0AAD9L8P5_PAPLA|nr:major facilitator superfamily domain-containing protein [Papiliotrema laurentii]